MRLGPNLVEGRFQVRLNRFAATVTVDGRDELVHVANSGRMHELLVPGQRVLVKPIAGKHRKTRFDLTLVDLGITMASADARLPNALVAEALEASQLPQFRAYTQIRREVTFGESRLDLMLEGPAGCWYVETKSATLVVEGVGLFPDAPTSRGVKHMKSLTKAVEAGHRAAAIFVIQRDDAQAFATHDQADPEFAEAFRASLDSGVEAFAYKCLVNEQSITLSDRLPIKL